MKNQILFLISLFIVTTGFSQIEKGTKTIGFTGYLSQQNSSENQNYNFTLANNHKWLTYNASSNFNYFIKNNLSIGIGIGYTNTKQNDQELNTDTLHYYNNNSLQNTNGYIASLHSSYYMKMNDRFYFRINGTLRYQYGIGNSKYTSINSNGTEYVSNSDIISNSVFLGFSPSITYFITPKFGLDASFGNLFFNSQLGKSKSTDASIINNDNHTKQYTYGLNLSSSSFSLGVHYYF